MIDSCMSCVSQVYWFISFQSQSQRVSKNARVINAFFFDDAVSESEHIGIHMRQRNFVSKKRAFKSRAARLIPTVETCMKHASKPGLRIGVYT